MAFSATFDSRGVLWILVFGFVACSGGSNQAGTDVSETSGNDGTSLTTAAGGSTQDAVGASGVGVETSAVSGVGGSSTTGSIGGASTVDGTVSTTSMGGGLSVSVGGAVSTAAGGAASTSMGGAVSTVADSTEATTGGGTQGSSLGGAQNSVGGSTTVDTTDTTVGGASSTMGSGAGGASSNAVTSDDSTTGTGGTGTMPDPGCGTHKWACWPMPNTPNSGLPNPASYTDNGDGTVTDDVTGLVWQRDQPSGTYNFTAAVSYCDGLSLGGANDWRLPTRIEILSVEDVTQGGAKWSSAAFPGASGGFTHSGSDWILDITQTGAGQGHDYAWAFNMSDGILSNAYSKANATPVRCVRGNGSGEGPTEPAVAPPDQYTVVATGEVRDNYTGLIWQQGDSDNMVSWSQAVSYCSSLNLNGHTWRLPSLREISTLVDEATVAPAINETMFPGTHYGSSSNNWYWAAEQNGSSSWGLNFDDGFTGFNSGSASWNTFGPSWARCVR